MRTVVLLAGPSGSGKSRLAATVGCPRLNLDDFYRDGGAPDLPHTLGIPDWDDVATWDADAAVAAIARLCTAGRTEVPTYDIATSRRTGSQLLDLGPAPVFVAEGLFAAEIVPACRAAGVPVEALYLDRHRTQNLVRRFVRDVSEHRKPLRVLVRRGLALWRAEPMIRHDALALGCRPVSLAAAMAAVRLRCQ